MQRNTIAIVGLGLMGGSLGLALKQSMPALKRIGFSRSEDTIAQALELGLVDKASDSLQETISEADVILLATPLLSYVEMADACAKHMKKGAILTDVGSVKQWPNEVVLKALSFEQRRFFVPGHPIAGTENSGPKAAFETLYQQKKVILTPLPDTDPEALAWVENMWLAVGADLELIDPLRHDFIYATVSHTIQLMSYALMPMLDKVLNAWDLLWPKDNTMQQFLRLAASSPSMWHDIFRCNRHQIISSIRNNIQHMMGLKSLLKHQQLSALKLHIDMGKEKRGFFAQKLKERNPKSADYTKTQVSFDSNNEKLICLAFPNLIATMLMESISPMEYDYATGSGFHGITQSLLYAQHAPADFMIENSDKMQYLVGEFMDEMDHLIDLVRGKDDEALLSYLANAQALYHQHIKPAL